MNLVLRVDSSSAIGTASRRGLGKLRHVQTRYLWVQEKVAQNALKLEKINTKWNSSDMCTKNDTAETIDKMMELTNQIYKEGRAVSAKRLVE